MALLNIKSIFEHHHINNYRLNVLYGIKLFGHEYKNTDPFEVKTYKSGEYITISSSDYYNNIRMKDGFIDRLRGITWESKVRNAQRKAFDAAYLKWAIEWRKNYQVERLK